jgi:putative salt-induced outer membrane protein YdiY
MRRRDGRRLPVWTSLEEIDVMQRLVRMASVALATVLVLGLWTTPAEAQDEKELGWFFTTELTAVWTAGNSQSTTFGLDAKLRHVWERMEFKAEGGGVRSQATKTTRTAVGTEDNFVIETEENTEKTAEAFYTRGRLDYNFSPRFFAFGGVDWLRNTFAGIDSRTLAVLGAGNTWADNDRVTFKTDYGVTYTFQTDVVENPFLKTNFPGIRAQYDLLWKATSTTEFTSSLIGDWMFSEEADAPDGKADVRLDFTNAVAIAISSKLALKPSLQLLWRNDPALTEVPLFATDGTPADVSVQVPLQKLDSFFKLALVVKF